MCNLVALVLASKAVLAVHRLVVLDVYFVSMGDLNSDLCHPVFLSLTVCSVQKDKHIP